MGDNLIVNVRSKSVPIISIFTYSSSFWIMFPIQTFFISPMKLIFCGFQTINARYIIRNYFNLSTRRGQVKKRAHWNAGQSKGTENSLKDLTHCFSGKKIIEPHICLNLFRMKMLNLFELTQLEVIYLMQYTHHAPLKNIQKFDFTNLDDAIPTLSAMSLL